MEKSNSRSSIARTAYLISVAYFAVVLILPVIYQNQRLTDLLPAYPTKPTLILLYLICLAVSIIIMLAANSSTRILSGIAIFVTLFSAIYLNRFNYLYNIHTRRPVVFQVEPGDILELADRAWPFNIPFDFYYSAYQKYPFSTLYTHPDIPNLDRILLFNRFGLELNISKDAPISISEDLFQELLSRKDLTYSSISEEEIEYLIFFPVDEGSEIYLTTYQSRYLIIPKDLYHD